MTDHEAFLSEASIPLRLSIADGDQPIIVPLWYLYEDGRFWCACHETSYLVKRIRAQSTPDANNVACAFDISTNEPPYKGVRGAGRVSLVSEQGADRLRSLLDRYLGDTDSDFANWLLSRADGEEALCIEPDRISSWDFTARMTQ